MGGQGLPQPDPPVQTPGHEHPTRRESRPGVETMGVTGSFWCCERCLFSSAGEQLLCAANRCPEARSRRGSRLDRTGDLPITSFKTAWIKVRQKAGRWHLLMTANLAGVCARAIFLV